MDSNEAITRLRENAIFAPCGAQLLEFLAEHASLGIARRGSAIARAGVPFPYYLGLVCEGIIAVMANSEGPMRGIRRLQLYQADRGSLFGEIAYFAESPPGDILTISKQAVYALLPSTAVEYAIEREPDLLRRLSKHVVQREHELGRRTAAPHGWSATARIARVLLRFAQQRDGLAPALPELGEFTQRARTARTIAFLRRTSGCRPAA